jgi:hypothetical protein
MAATVNVGEIVASQKVCDTGCVVMVAGAFIAAATAVRDVDMQPVEVFRACA